MTPTTADNSTPRHVSQLATVAEVAAYLQLNTYTVRAYAREGVIPAYRVARSFRFDWQTIQHWLEARQHHPSTAAAVEVDQLQLSPEVTPRKRPVKAVR